MFAPEAQLLLQFGLVHYFLIRTLPFDSFLTPIKTMLGQHVVL